MRFAVMQVWPEFRELAQHRPGDGRVEVGVVEDEEGHALPPSSSETFFS